MKTFIVALLATFVPMMALSQHAGMLDHHGMHMFPDDNPPIGVMAVDHHMPGKVMLSYRHMRGYMDGNLDGVGKESTAEVLADFLVAPTDMTVEMHMFGAMTHINNKFSAMIMAPYIRKKMNHVNRANVTFQTKSAGMGDVKLTGAYELSNTKSSMHARDGANIQLKFGLSLPTGSIDERDTTPLGVNQLLPYPMQLGSGTYDPIIGISRVEKFDDWSWGNSAEALIRVGKNQAGYRLGDEYVATSWIAKNVYEKLSASARLEARYWGDINGHDQRSNQAVVPTSRPDLRNGRRVDAVLGVNFYDGKQSRAGLEVGLPIYQYLDGPQLENDYRIMLGGSFRW